MPSLPTNPHNIGDSGHVNDHNTIVTALSDAFTSLDTKAPIASPTLTGTPLAPTASAGTSTTQIATTAFVQAASGMVLIKKQAWSSTTSQAVTSCFSSTYQNYRVMFRQDSASANGSIQLRFGAVASNYTYQVVRGYGTTVNAFQGNPATEIFLGQSNTGALCTISFDVYGPQAAKATFVTGTGMQYNGTDWTTWQVGGALNATTQFTDMTMLGNGQNVTGTIWVYGLKDA